MDRQRTASSISGGIFLIGLGVLGMTGWWWPGIMVVIGLSSGAELIFRGKTTRGISTLAFFIGIPILIAVVQATAIPWRIVGPMILIVLGVITLVKAFVLPED